VLGSNGPRRSDRLRFARSDAESIGLTLRRYCGFKLFDLQARGLYRLREALWNAAESCTSSDDLLVYFSGHGELFEGRLFLLLDNTTSNLARSALPASWILEALTGSRARNKILVLDCCNAGGAVGWKGAKMASLIPSGPTMALLCASDSFESARELASLNGSFLAHAFSEIVAERPTVSLTSLAQELRRKAQQHNEANPSETVPLPFLKTDLRGEFFFRGFSDAILPNPLVQLSATLRLSNVPSGIIKAVKKGLADAERSVNDPSFVDMLEHHNAGPDDAELLIERETRRVIQSFVTVLATDQFESGHAVLAFGFHRPSSTLFPVGWVANAQSYERAKGKSLLPSGILIADEMNAYEIIFGDATRDHTARRMNTVQPFLRIASNNRELSLTMEFSPSALYQSVVRYSPAPLTETLPPEIGLLTWFFGDEENENQRLPFGAKAMSPSLVQMQLREPDSVSKMPTWLRSMELHLVPNGSEEGARTYALSIACEESLFDGPRGDDPLGYVRYWRGARKPSL
jgi:hypothetical protein